MCLNFNSAADKRIFFLLRAYLRRYQEGRTGATEQQTRVSMALAR